MPTLREFARGPQGKNPGSQLTLEKTTRPVGSIEILLPVGEAEQHSLTLLKEKSIDQNLPIKYPKSSRLILGYLFIIYLSPPRPAQRTWPRNAAKLVLHITKKKGIYYLFVNNCDTENQLVDLLTFTLVVTTLAGFSLMVIEN